MSDSRACNSYVDSVFGFFRAVKVDPGRMGYCVRRYRTGTALLPRDPAGY